MMNNFGLFLIFLFIITSNYLLVARAGDILFLIYLTSPSNRIFLKPFIDVLISRGHNVTVITNLENSSLSSNITEIPLHVDEKIFPQLNELCFVDFPNKPWLMYRAFEQYLTDIAGDDLTKNEKMMEMIQSCRKFDVVFTSGLFEEHSLPVAALFSNNIIFLHFMRILPSFAYEMDVIQPYSYVPLTLSKLRSKMNFLERVANSLMSFYFAALFRDLKKMDGNIAKKLPEAPSLAEVHSRVSLIFLNSDPILYNAAPIMPHVVSLGGMNCREAKPLPKNLEEIMSNSTEYGVIYFSMGTVVDLRQASKDLPEKFLDVFSRLNQTIIWKVPFEIEKVPENVKLVNWVPQQDILGHPKLSLYITQGGIFSLQEALYHGVPILGLPISTDQFSNVIRMEELGLGQHLDMFDLRTEEIYSAITEILNDSGYQERSKKYSAIFRDNIENPMERAVYWTEYLIKHPESSLHFRTSSSHLNVFQYHSLDILLLITTLLIIWLWVFHKLVLICYHFSWGK